MTYDILTYLAIATVGGISLFLLLSLYSEHRSKVRRRR